MIFFSNQLFFYITRTRAFSNTLCLKVSIAVRFFGMKSPVLISHVRIVLQKYVNHPLISSKRLKIQYSIFFFYSIPSFSHRLWSNIRETIFGGTLYSFKTLCGPKPSWLNPR